jgi:hypothetical protein
VEFVLVSNDPTKRLHSVRLVLLRRRSSLYSLKTKGEWVSLDFKTTKIYPREFRKFYKEKNFFLDCLILEDGIDRLSRNDSKKTTILRCGKSQKSAGLIYTTVEVWNQGKNFPAYLTF